MNVLLVSMPYGALERQALGLSLLKARLAEAGISCDVNYLTFAFADLIGLDNYRWISNDVPYTAFAGDWSFTTALYGSRPTAETRYVEEILRRTFHLSDASIARVFRIRSMTIPFLDYALEAGRWREYNVVGFTSTFEQNIASLALARRIKQRYPHIQIVFGGANWESVMGLELHRRFPFVDFVCSGEAEVSFPQLIEAIAANDRTTHRFRTIPGIVYRDQETSVATGPGRGVALMDDLPIPDYSDYFRQLAESSVGVSVVPTLLFETSRGCWWGAKSHCTFCGLNGGAMTFRSKSSRRALAELRTLADRWQVEIIEAVDNILDMKYFKDFLPELARERLQLQLFYEVKANLTRKHLRVLKEAGVHRMQPGIESLSDHVLTLMRKGTTALQNIQLLKWCREYGIVAEWNLLYGFPGETREDYRATLELLSFIRHLGPPTACGPLRLDRFSPYHESPVGLGVTNIRALSSYEHLYPFDPETLKALAYYFDYDYAPGLDPRGFADDVIRDVEAWKQSPEPGMLTALRHADGSLVLVDSRSDARQTTVALAGREQSAYEYCDEAHNVAAVTRHLHDRFPDDPTCERHVRAFLDAAVSRRLMVRDGDRYLNVAIANESLRHAIEDAGVRSMSLAVMSDATALCVAPA